VAARHDHGRRSARDRRRAQDGFASGAIRVVAATNAFGLGIDEPDVRFVRRPPGDGPCGNCDNDDLPAGGGAEEAAAGPAPGARVAHRTFGPGTVTRVQDGTVTVLFDEAGYRTLDGELVADVLSDGPET
jgi:hypothetical protein